MEEPTWELLFERARTYEATVDAVCETLATHRDHER